MIESLVVWLIIGAIAGWLAGLIVKGYGLGLVGMLTAPLLDLVGHVGDPRADDERQTGVFEVFAVGFRHHPGVGDAASYKQAVVRVIANFAGVQTGCELGGTIGKMAV